MGTQQILDQIVSERNLAVLLANSRERAADAIAEDYNISWLYAFCIAGLLNLRRAK
jgi:hypothetical protein